MFPQGHIRKQPAQPLSWYPIKTQQRTCAAVPVFFYGDAGCCFTMTNNRAQAQQLHLDSLNNYDSVQLSLTCLSGVDRHLVVTRDRLKDLLVKKDAVNFGSDIPQNSLIFDSVSSCGAATVDISSLRPLPWLSTDGRRVGGAMCHIAPPTLKGSSLPCVSARSAALQQIARLREEFGLEIKSAFEMEFMIYEKFDDQRDGTVPFNDSTLCNYGRIDSWAGREHCFFDTCQSLVRAGLPIESLMTEMAAGQFEITFKPQIGVASPDSVILAKEGLRKCLGISGLTPTFMASPSSEGHFNGFHLNHSLWRAATGRFEGTNDGQAFGSSPVDGDVVKGDALNAFLDSDDPLLLSATARHWLAGLIQHGPGLALISSPTLNCARRLQDPLTPKRTNWAVENRSAFLRIRNAKDNVYVENRLPSSASNPYLVLASVLAAGMDGLRRQLECPPPGDTHAQPIPTTLEEAVSCLQGDSLLTDALGEDLVSAILSHTRKSLGGKNCQHLEDLDRQRQIYFRYI
ncbi:glutamine synthetase [Plakobranchus ocellatus]|uniref:Lengsin n=1 Tax=Plakobranchus ocellatus TaxID=259542 RepID=A0AAV3Z5P7_9GAST|nr:glutamine synthetase [Plakobranchus ocellatus]